MQKGCILVQRFFYLESRLPFDQFQQFAPFFVIFNPFQQNFKRKIADYHFKNLKINFKKIKKNLFKLDLEFQNAGCLQMSMWKWQKREVEGAN